MAFTRILLRFPQYLLSKSPPYCFVLRPSEALPASNLWTCPTLQLLDDTGARKYHLSYVWTPSLKHVSLVTGLPAAAPLPDYHSAAVESTDLPSFTSPGRTFRIVVSDTVVLPCDVDNPGMYTYTKHSNTPLMITTHHICRLFSSQRVVSNERLGRVMAGLPFTAPAYPTIDLSLYVLMRNTMNVTFSWQMKWLLPKVN